MQLSTLLPTAPKNLDELFANDDLGLFSNITPPKKTAISSPLENKFVEIIAFIEQHQREPSPQGNLTEKRLARSLKSIRNNQEDCKTLAKLDRLGLLIPKSKPQSLEDIFADDDLGLLEMGDTSILEITHITPLKNKITNYEGELIGERSKCEDFWRFLPTFTLLHQFISTGSFHSEKQKSEDMQKGEIFILQGLLCMVVDKQNEDRQSQRKNTRLRIIFENGTESNMLARSLYSALRKDEFSKKLMFKREEDACRYYAELFGKKTGYIYVVKLQTPKTELSQFKHLYKIGFTSTSVEERIKNCENDIAFLESRVKPVVTFECYSLNPHKLEILLHEFLHAQKIQLSLISKNGFTYQPKEWFDVPLETIEQVIEKLLSGEIGKYRMDNIRGKLIKI